LKRIPSLDGFRAISIILVLISHCRFSIGFPVSLIDLARQCEVGVTIFFVISGFLITTLMLDEETMTGNLNIRLFYMRRIFRIIPVYLLYVIFISLWLNAKQIGLTKYNLVHVLTFTVNFDQKFQWFVAHFWTLSIEEQFYLFWPAILVLFRKNLKIILIILIAYSCLTRVIAYKFPSFELLTLSSFFKYSGSIFVGAFAGVLFFEKPEILKNRLFASYFAQVIALIVFLMFVYFTEWGVLAIISLPFGNLIISLSVMFLISAYLLPSDKIVFKILNHKAVMHIGVLSYSIYIWQQFFFVGVGFWCLFPYNILASYLVGLVSYHLWEKPFLKFRKYFSANKLQPEIVNN
jgi:peptidoglycan/LPS O-acetylase OafA/YrhL